MTSMKTVLLGSAAAIVATGAAQAADLPVKKAAAAVQYVEACPVYGRNFYKLPGTDICIKHTGSLEARIGYQDPRESISRKIKTDGSSDKKGLIVGEDAANTTGWYVKAKPAWDVRSPTEFGTLRTYVGLKFEIASGIFEDLQPNIGGDDSVKLDKAYIEWAGFTVGIANSQMEYWAQDDVILRINGGPKYSPFQVTYAWNFGGGTKATLGIEDPGENAGHVKDVGDFNGNSSIGFTFKEDGPMRAFDVVASLSTEQSWGSAKIAGVLHPIQTASGFYVTKDPSKDDATEIFTSHTTKWGWAVNGGVTLKLPSLGADDQIAIQGTHCKGYVKVCLDTDDAHRIDEKGQYLAGLQRRDYDAFAVANPDGVSYHLETTKVTSAAAQLRHYWNPMLRSNLSGSYMKITTPAIAKTFDLSDGGLGDAKAWDVALNLIWGKERKTAEIGVEALYKSVKQDLPNGALATDACYRTSSTAGTSHCGIDKDPSGWAFVGWIKRGW